MATQRLDLAAMTVRDVHRGCHVLQERLEQWGCGRVPEGLLLFSALATNAVVHAGGAPLISIFHGAQSLRVEVHDNVHDIPKPRSPRTHPAAGFGLNIVTKLGDGWGWRQTSTGKVVWSALPCCPDE